MKSYKFLATDNRDGKHSPLSMVRERRVNANLYTVSIGFEGVHRETNGRLAPAQLEAGVRVIRHIISEVRRRFGVEIPVARTHIVGHFEVTPITRPNCPGAEFPFDEIIRMLGGSVAIAPSQPQQQAAEPLPNTPSAQRIFRIRVGSFATIEEAREVASELNEKGHTGAFAVQNGAVWQAQAGSGGNIFGAERLAETLRVQGFDNVVIV